MKLETIADLAELTRQRQAELDEQIGAWCRDEGSGVRLWCGPGCGNCCTLAVNTTLPEAVTIAGRLDAEQQHALTASAAGIVAHARSCTDARDFLAGYRQAVGPCPFLDTQASCSIYQHRPLACRALLSTRPADWCGVNLATLPACERDAFLASLDRRFVAFPTHYAAAPRELAADFERGLIIAMFRFIGFGVTGNLPLLVWLAGQAGFDDALAGGAATFQSYLSEHNVSQPFLVQIDRP